MKIMNQSSPSSETEMIILLNINHENIVRYFDHFSQQISNANFICVVTEFCEVLSNIIRQLKNLKAIFYNIEKIPNQTVAKELKNGKKILIKKLSILSMSLTSENY